MKNRAVGSNPTILAIQKAIMYQYLLCAYQQWCDGKGVETIESSGDEFIELVHNINHYDKQVLREFLVKQPWFHSKLGDGLL